jgi:hypothetical protein
VAVRKWHTKQKGVSFSFCVFSCAPLQLEDLCAASTTAAGSLSPCRTFFLQLLARPLPPLLVIADVIIVV